MKSLKQLIDEILEHPDVAHVEVTTWDDVQTMSTYNITYIGGNDANAVSNDERAIQRRRPGMEDTTIWPKKR